MKQLFLFLSLQMILCPVIWAQRGATLSTQSTSFLPKTQQWVRFSEPVPMHQGNIFWEIQEAFGLQTHHELATIREEKDAIGQEHQWMQLSHRGYAVEWAEAIVHGKNGSWNLAQGFLPILEQPLPAIGLGETEALTVALAELGAEVYMWEEPAYENMMQDIKQDPQASFYPKGELLWVDADYDWQSLNYRLAYRFEIFTAQPHGSYWVYVDAENGELLKQLSSCHEIEVDGTAQTRHNGQQNIRTDSVSADSFRLREYDRASAGIETYDLNNSTNLATAVDFWDEDNDWNNVNLQWDEVATDVHWGMEMVYDYFLQVHGRDSYDGNGGKLLSYVHYDVPGSQTAFWNVFYAGFADDSGNPHVGLDVVGHEVTHGLVRNSCNLIYINEGGALNEGSADIFGNVIQHYTTPDSFSWLVGENSTAFRNMADPNSYGDPDTYKGSNWYSGQADNGGAHTNANVLTHWFYLLAEGGSGINDLGSSYTLTGITIEKAADIFYRAMTIYWTPTTQFGDAREGTIQAAEDLYGVCSPEAIATINTWHAVGVGEAVQDQDVGVSQIILQEACGSELEQYVTIEIFNHGCATIPGGQINVLAEVPALAAIAIEPAGFGDLSGRSYGIHEFTTPFSLPIPGDHELRARTLFPADPQNANNQAPPATVHRRHEVAPFFWPPITFENPAQGFLDSLWWENGPESEVQIKAGVGVDSSTAIQINGGYGFGYLFVESFPLWGGPAPDVFDFNEEFGSKICFCADGGFWNALFLEFDLRQTYSTYFLPKFSNPSLGHPNPDSLLALASSALRVLVDGEEIARYTPQSPQADSFQTQNLVLAQGFNLSKIQVCFESRTVWSQEEDLSGMGDHIFIDNIKLDGETVGNEPSISVDWAVFPNPAKDEFRVEASDIQPGPTSLHLYNSLGQLVWEESWRNSGNQLARDVQTGQFPRGLYQLVLQTASSQAAKSVLLH